MKQTLGQLNYNEVYKRGLLIGTSEAPGERRSRFSLFAIGLPQCKRDKVYSFWGFTWCRQTPGNRFTAFSLELHSPVSPKEK